MRLIIGLLILETAFGPLMAGAHEAPSARLGPAKRVLTPDARARAIRTSAEIAGAHRKQAFPSSSQSRLEVGLESLSGGSASPAEVRIKNKLPAMEAIIAEGDSGKLLRFKISMTRTLGDVFFLTETAQLRIESAQTRYEALQDWLSQAASNDPNRARVEALQAQVAREYLAAVTVFAENIDDYLPLSRFLQWQLSNLTTVVAPRVRQDSRIAEGSAEEVARAHSVHPFGLESLEMADMPMPQRNLQVDQNNMYRTLVNFFDQAGVNDLRAPSEAMAIDQSFRTAWADLGLGEAPELSNYTRLRDHQPVRAANIRMLDEHAVKVAAGELDHLDPVERQKSEASARSFSKDLGRGSLLQRDHLIARCEETAVQLALYRRRVLEQAVRVGKKAVLAIDAREVLNQLTRLGKNSPKASASQTDGAIRRMIEALLRERRLAEWQDRWGQTLSELRMKHEHESDAGNAVDGVINLLGTCSQQELKRYTLFDYLARRKDLSALWETVSSRLLERTTIEPAFRKKLLALRTERDRGDFAWINPNYRRMSPVGVLTTVALVGIAWHFGLIPGVDGLTERARELTQATCTDPKAPGCSP